MDVTLTPTERELVLRLAHGARIHWTLGGQSIIIGTPGIDAVSVPGDVFDRLRELEFFDADEQGPLSTYYGLSTPGRAWADENIDMQETPGTGPLGPERDPVHGLVYSDEVRLSATARDAVLRLTGGAHIIHETTVQRVTIGSPSTGYTTLRRPAFDRLCELRLIEMTAEGPHSADYQLSVSGQRWAHANIGRDELRAAATPRRRERAARPIVRHPVCDAEPVPFADDPAVCDHCGNLIAVHPRAADPAARRRIDEAMWRVVIALGGPHNPWTGGDDEQTSLHFREHMAGCGIDWDHMTTARPQMEEVGLTHDSENNTTVQLLGGWLKCLCGRVNDQVTVRDLTPGQLMWQVTNLDAAPPLALS